MDFLSEVIIPTVSGGVLGGIVGALDANSKGQNIFNGRSKDAKTKFITKGNGISDDSRNILLNGKNKEFKINKGFEGDLDIKLKNNTNEDLHLKYGKENKVIGPQDRLIDKIPSSNSKISIEFEPTHFAIPLSPNNSINLPKSNTPRGPSIETPTIHIGSSISTIKISGQWRSFAGFLWY